MARTLPRKRIVVSPNVRIRKSSGFYERFSPTKLERSLIRCGTPSPNARKITTELKGFIHPDFSTEKLRKLVHTQLKEAFPSAATRYELSRSIMKLGPTGFPFEKLIGQLYESEGYEVSINQLKAGRCVNHEIDVIAKKDGRTIFMECKFHNIPGAISDLKTSLYVKARSDDLNNSSDRTSHHDSFALVTNTRFSSEGLAFGNCAGLQLIGWTYPTENSLCHRLEVSGLIPLTALTTLPRKLAEILMQEGVVTVRDFIDRPEAWRMLGNNPKRIDAVQNEIDALLEIGWDSK